MSKALTWTAIAAAPVLLLGGCLGSVVLLAPQQTPTCSAAGAGASALAASLPGQSAAGYDAEQLANVAAIINAGKALGLDARTQTIGVMTAMGESSLRVLDHGDAVGPDSRGLFQQRANGAWGSEADRMDPTISATKFFAALMGVPGWETLAPTIAAHRVQRNADPYHYETYWAGAVTIVSTLAHLNPGTIQASVRTQGCDQIAVDAASVTAAGWARPNAGPLRSGFGMRVNPGQINFGTYRLHAGIDFAGPCGSGILAAAGGVVVRTGYTSGGGYDIALDNGGGVLTRYLHMYASGVLVRAGQQVRAGEQIGLVGNEGNTTGCHLHFEVHTAGGLDNTTAIDPLPFLTHRGVVLT